MAAANIKLPKIPHSGLHRQTDIDGLRLTGNALIEGKKYGKAAGPKPVRPSTVPNSSTLSQTPKQQRPKTTELSTNQLFDTIADKLKGNGYFIMRNTFNSFDPEHKGTVTREALYRILCNTLGGIAHSQFRQILDKIGLNEKKVVSFNEFYSRFRITSSREATHWLDKNHGPPPCVIGADYVHSMLTARAGQCVNNLYTFLPQWKGLEGQIDRAEFKNTLNTLSLSLTNDQYQKLWNKYDPSGMGYITGQQLLNKLGVKGLIDSSSSQTYSMAHSSKDNKRSDKVTALETTIGKKTSLLMDEFIKQDINNSGKINSDQVYSCLHNLGILMTKEQCNHMITRLGFQSDRPIVYQSLINALSSHSTGGLTHAVLTDASQKFRLDLSRQACVSTPDAEATLVCSLHKDFLQLMSQLKSRDPEGTGLIPREHFINVVKGYLPSDSSSTDPLETLADKLLDKDTSCVVYSKFLSLFDGAPQPVVVENKSKAIKNDKEIIHNIKEVRDKLIELCSTYPGSVLQAYETLDPKNTSRITQELLQQILFRLGLNVKNDVVLSLWSEVLKNKDGSIHPHELVRHFTKRYQKRPTDHPTNNWEKSDDRLHMRSKFLHRDIDIVLKNLHTMLSLYQRPIYSYLRYNDPSSTGLVSSEVFQQLLLTLCPQLSCEELVYVTKQFQESANMVNYTALMKGLSPVQPVYKTGNDLGTLLSHCPAPTVSLPILSFPVTSPPQHGLPGVRVKLQRKLMEKWTELKRHLVKLDPFGTGSISVKNFRQILIDFGVSLSREDMYYILQELDPLLTGKVNYAMFLQLLMGRQ